jgi:hypothetical protein
VQLGDALPPPVEATLPAPYVTPGLEDVDPRAPREEDLADAQPELSRPFQPHGTIYGAAPEQSVVTLQAIRTVLVVIKGPGDRIVFAQPLSPGEAYRVPQASGLIIDVAAPKSIEVFVAGMSKGTLKEPLTPASTLAASAPRPAARPAAPTASTPAPKPTTPPAVASPTAPKATVPAGAAPPAAKAIAPAAAPPPAPKAAPPTAAAPPLAAPAEPSETPAP